MRDPLQMKGIRCRGNPVCRGDASAPLRPHDDVAGAHGWDEPRPWEVSTIASAADLPFGSIEVAQAMAELAELDRQRSWLFPSEAFGGGEADARFVTSEGPRSALQVTKELLGLARPHQHGTVTSCSCRCNQERLRAVRRISDRGARALAPPPLPEPELGVLGPMPPLAPELDFAAPPTPGIPPYPELFGLAPVIPAAKGADACEDEPPITDASQLDEIPSWAQLSMLDFDVDGKVMPYYHLLGRSLEANNLSTLVTTAIISLHGAYSECTTGPAALNQLEVWHEILYETLDPNPFQILQTVVFAPQFQVGDWRPWPNALRWAPEGAATPYAEGWAASNSPHSLCAMDVLDRMLFRIGATCPNLKQVVIIGHSGGAQAAQRYALLDRGVRNWLWQARGCTVRYIGCNPGFYTYFTPARPLLPENPTTEVVEDVLTVPALEEDPDWYIPSPGTCSGAFDSFPEGLGNAIAGVIDDPAVPRRVHEAYVHAVNEYGSEVAAAYGEDHLQDLAFMLAYQYAKADVWHVQNMWDTEITHSSCARQLRGPSRAQRFLSFRRHMDMVCDALGVTYLEFRSFEGGEFANRHSSTTIYNSPEVLSAVGIG